MTPEPMLGAADMPAEDRASRSSPNGIETVLVPAGLVIVGADRPTEGPATRLRVPAFRIGRLAVTNAQFGWFLAASGYGRDEFWDDDGRAWRTATGQGQPAYWQDDRFNRPEQPATGVSYFEACAFARFVGGRLPTEVEWEAAARGGDGRTYPWGEEEPAAAQAWFAPGFVPQESTTQDADALPGGDSPHGCRQMAGNVFEWCWDYFHLDTPERRADGALVERRPSPRRVLKGGAWHTGASRLRCSARWSFTPDLRDNVVGFRVAFDADRS